MAKNIKDKVTKDIIKEKELNQSIQNLSKNDEFFCRIYAGKALGEIRKIEFPDNLPAMVQTYLNFLGIGIKDDRIKKEQENKERTIQGWISTGLPLNNIPKLAECFNKDVKFFIPDFIEKNEILKKTIDKIFKNNGFELLAEHLKKIPELFSENKNYFIEIIELNVNKILESITNEIEIKSFDEEEKYYQFIMQRLFVILAFVK